MSARPTHPDAHREAASARERHDAHGLQPGRPVCSSHACGRPTGEGLGRLVGQQEGPPFPQREMAVRAVCALTTLCLIDSLINIVVRQESFVEGARERAGRGCVCVCVCLCAHHLMDRQTPAHSQGQTGGHGVGEFRCKTLQFCDDGDDRDGC